MEPKNSTYIRRMADYACGIRLQDLPSSIISKVKLCIIDALECCISPMTDDRAKAALQSIDLDGSSCRSTLFGAGHKANAIDAAFYNTVKGSITSRNDTSLEAGCHPGSLLIPTVFALAEENCASGAQVIEAVLAGYETMIRFGSLLKGRMNRAWRTTAVFGPVGAAFAASKVAGFDGMRTAVAASFACHSCSGVNEWALSGTGEDVFQNALGARNGILAMRLARSGIPGCMTILEGESGIAAAFGIRDGFEKLTAGIGEVWMIERVIQKPITSCIIVQNPCQTAAALLREHPEIRASEISRVQIHVSKNHRDHFGCSNNQQIDTLVQAIMSIALGVAGTLVSGGCDHLSWTPPIDPQILDLMRRCDVLEDETYTRENSSASRITVFMRDGRKFTCEKERLTPLTEIEVRNRFHETCVESIGIEKTAEAEELLDRMEQLDSICRLTELLAK